MVDLASLIRNVPDFPVPGIQFKDITTLVQAPEGLKATTDLFVERYKPMNIEAIVAADARGFIFGAPVAYLLGVPFVPVRKKGKLPAETFAEECELEYGTATLEIHCDALKPGQRVLLMDDLLAAGGTMAAVARLVKRLDAEIVEAAFVVELPLLNGRETLKGIPVHSLVSFMVH